MVDIKSAVAAAMDFASNSLGHERTVNIRLEEIESSNLDGNEVWLITLSTALRFSGTFVSLGAVLGADIAREYKVFTVAKSDGEVLSMKIRLLAVPTMT